MLRHIIFFWMLLCHTISLFAASHHPQEFLKGIEHSPNAAEKIYQHFCENCHAEHPLIPLGAPRLGDKKAWKSRVSVGKKTLVEHTLNGYGLMPARGGCFECSDAQLEAVVDWILSKK